jgi:hypothetical protein
MVNQHTNSWSLDGWQILTIKHWTFQKHNFLLLIIEPLIFHKHFNMVSSGSSIIIKASESWINGLLIVIFNAIPISDEETPVSHK